METAVDHLSAHAGSSDLEQKKPRDESRGFSFGR
jgi:hypothetical protein